MHVPSAAATSHAAPLTSVSSLHVCHMHSKLWQTPQCHCQSNSSSATTSIRSSRRRHAMQSSQLQHAGGSSRSSQACSSIMCRAFGGGNSRPPPPDPWQQSSEASSSPGSSSWSSTAGQAGQTSSTSTATRASSSSSSSSIHNNANGGFFSNGANTSPSALNSYDPWDAAAPAAGPAGGVPDYERTDWGWDAAEEDWDPAEGLAPQQLADLERDYDEQMQRRRESEDPPRDKWITPLLDWQVGTGSCNCQLCCLACCGSRQSSAAACRPGGRSTTPQFGLWLPSDSNGIALAAGSAGHQQWCCGTLLSMLLRVSAVPKCWQCLCCCAVHLRCL